MLRASPSTPPPGRGSHSRSREQSGSAVPCCPSPTSAGSSTSPRGLVDLGIELVSTGGTAQELESAGVGVRAIDDLTGFPEIMDGRVKTLHPKLYAGLLAVRDNPEHVRAASEHDIEYVDLVVRQPLPLRAHRRAPGNRRGRGDREHRHRRPDDDPRRGQEPRLQRRRRAPRELRRGPRRAARGRRHAEHGHARGPRRRRPSPTPRATTSPSAAGSPRRARTSRRCTCARTRRSSTCPTARTRTSAPPSTRRSAPARHVLSQVQQHARQAISLQQHPRPRRGARRRTRLRRSRLRDRQAQQPVRRRDRHRARSRPTGARSPAIR